MAVPPFKISLLTINTLSPVCIQLRAVAASMLKSEFETDHRTTPSSNSPGSPAKNGSSGRDRNTISESAVGVIGGLRRDIDSHESGRNDSKRRKDNERQKDKWDRDHIREHFRYIALSTLRTLDEGEYFPPGQDGPYDLKMKILRTNENTRYYGPDAGECGEILGSEFTKINEESNKDGTSNTGVWRNQISKLSQ